MSLTFHPVLRKLYTEPSKGTSYQIAVHLATRFQRRIFCRNQPIRNKNFLWWPCQWMDWDKMSNLHRGPSIDVSYHILVHLAKRFQKRRYFRNLLIRNKNCLLPPCLWTNRAEMNNLYRGPSIYMLPIKFRFIWPSGFRGENCLEINQSETRIAYGGHVCKRIRTKWAIFIENLP